MAARRGDPAAADLIAAGRGVLAAGEIIDYRITVGDAELRVQKSRRSTGPAPGEACRLSFARPRWYPA